MFKETKFAIESSNFMISFMHFNMYIIFFWNFFFTKNLSKLVDPRLKLHNPYYHKQHTYNIYVVNFCFEILEFLHACTLQMFTGIYRDSVGKSECGEFKFMGIACIPAIVILKSSRSDFHVKIVGILTLQGYYGDTQSYIYQVL